MAVSNFSLLGFNSVQVSRSCVGSTARKSTQFSSTPLLINSSRVIKCKRKHSRFLVAESDRTITDRGESFENVESALALQDATPTSGQLEKSIGNDSTLPASATSTGSNTAVEVESQKSPSVDAQSALKKTPLTARERLRAARVFNRYSESKPTKSEMGRSVLDALRESEKGKKGLPEAPTNLFDDSKRGMPKAGLTFDFPGGFDLFIIAFSFVFISTVMFATTYIVWKVGAIHFNEY